MAGREGRDGSSHYNQEGAMSTILKCLNDSGLRGSVPQEINEDISYALGMALLDTLSPKKVVLGYDGRSSSPALYKALASAFLANGVKVYSLGLCGTEEVYYASAHADVDLAVMITGSRAPIGENGFKLVKRGAIPLDPEFLLNEVAVRIGSYRDCALRSKFDSGATEPLNLRTQWIERLLEYAGFDRAALRTLKVVIDASNGPAASVLQELAPRLPIEVIPLNFPPDGLFSYGAPDPLLSERRAAISQAIIANRANLGIAFDGDFDRCYFFNHRGDFIETCYIGGLLASHLLMKNPGEKIVHDPGVYWNTRDLIYTGGGIPVLSRSGAFCMKDSLRREDALYGVDTSGRHFYKDFAWSESGMLTMLLVLALLIRSGQSLAELVEAGEAAYPCSGEAIFSVINPVRVLDAVWEKYGRDALSADQIDGISLEYAGWRFNLRYSSTDQLLRLNVESRGDSALVAKKLAQLGRFIENA